MTFPAQPNIGGTAMQIGGADAPATAGNTPTMAHLMVNPNRLVAIIPKSIGMAKSEYSAEPIRRIIADVLVIDGGPLTFGGKPLARPVVADTMIVNQLPYLARGMWINNTVLIDQLERKVGAGIAVGRLYYGEATNGNNAPYKITENPTPEEIDFVTRWWAAYSAGQWNSPEPTPIGAPQAPQMSFNAPANTAQFTAPAQPMGGFAAPVLNPASPNPTMPAFQFAPQGLPAPVAEPVDWTLTTMPPGVPQEQLQAWQTTTTRGQREQMLAAAGITAPPNGTPTALPTGL